MTTSEQKRALRERALDYRRSLDAAQKAEFDAALCKEISAREEFLHADLLLTFFPVRGEIDLIPLARLARKRGILTAYPRCEGKELRFFIVGSEAELFPDAFGIPAPKKSADAAHFTKQTLCLLPALAGDKKCRRLGYGGGFYDRFLSTFAGKTILPLYGALLYDEIPTDENDRPATIILTEKGVYAPLCQN